MRNFIYKVTVQHDTGKANFKTVASSEEKARATIRNIENCPDSAIIKIKLIKEI
jgi:hypothetical protein